MRKTRKEGYVYLIRADNNLYKIGQSKRHTAKERFKALQGLNACTLELLWVWETEDRFALENLLHRFFWVRRHHREWFALSESNVHFVLGLTKETIQILQTTKDRLTWWDYETWPVEEE